MNTNSKRDSERITHGISFRIYGFVLLVAAVIPVLSLISYDWHDIKWLNICGNTNIANLLGPLGAYSTFLSLSLFGLAAWTIPIIMVIMGIRMLLDKLSRPLYTFIWLFLATIFISAFLELFKFHDICTSLHLHRTAPGGAFGYIITDLLLINTIGKLSTTFLLIALILMAIGFSIGWRNIASAIRYLYDEFNVWRENMASEEHRLEIEQRRLEKEIAEQERREAKERKQQEREAAKEAKRQAQNAREEERIRVREEEKRIRQEHFEARKAELERRRQEELAENQEEIEDEENQQNDLYDEEQPTLSHEECATATPTKYSLPSIDLLSPIPEPEEDDEDTDFYRDALVNTLHEFKIDVEVTGISKGPILTTYELLPASGIKPEDITSMAKTLEMRLCATCIRIEAPIPGKGVIGVEIPKKHPSPVTVREILEGAAWKKATESMHIPMLLGKDTSGKELICDLASMPHMLIAGSTGSGKSVCLNAILTGWLMSRKPEDLRLILVDPKTVEFSGYRDIPHLVVPIISDPEKVSLGLIWAIKEMERRYKLLSKAGVKNIESYNARKPKAVQQDMFALLDGQAPAPKPTNELPNHLPYIVVVIDELADIMAVVGNEIETGISRLAAKARAAGIHLILATQRPVVKVVTGVIKANIPGRIAFKVAQANDSGTIIDQKGAEALIGKGDMLFKNPKVIRLLRGQGAYISDPDAEAICDYVRSQCPPQYMQEVVSELEEKPEEEQHKKRKGTSRSLPDFSQSSDDTNENDEELFNAAIEALRRTGRASTSSLQRALRIGYNTAARLMDMLEDREIIGPPRGASPREILVDLNAENPMPVHDDIPNEP